MQVGKSGYMFILNRVTGKPVCKHLCDKTGGLYNGDPFTPFLYHEERKTSQASIIFPGFSGGVNWGGTAIDPKLCYIFVNTKDAPAVGWMVKNPKYTPDNREGLEPYIRSGPRGIGQFRAAVRDPNGRSLGQLPCFKPPWGRLIAVNGATGDFTWDVPLGISDILPPEKQHTGASNTAGASAPPEAWCSSARLPIAVSARLIRGRERAFGDQARPRGHGQPNDLHGQERQTIHRHRRCGGRRRRTHAGLAVFALP